MPCSKRAVARSRVDVLGELHLPLERAVLDLHLLVDAARDACGRARSPATTSSRSPATTRTLCGSTPGQLDDDGQRVRVVGVEAVDVRAEAVPRGPRTAAPARGRRTAPRSPPAACRRPGGSPRKRTARRRPAGAGRSSDVRDRAALRRVVILALHGRLRAPRCGRGAARLSLGTARRRRLRTVLVPRSPRVRGSALALQRSGSHPVTAGLLAFVGSDALRRVRAGALVVVRLALDELP